MNIKTEAFKAGMGCAAAAVIGDYKLVVLLMAVMAVDTVFGHLRAHKNHSWKSGKIF